MYTVQWEACSADDISEEPVKRFGTKLFLELVEDYFTNQPDAKSRHPGYRAVK